MNIQLLKTHWAFSLKNVIIAGGFFRDNFLGVPIKDIDLWCTPDNAEDVHSQLRHRIAADTTANSKPCNSYSKLTEEAQDELTAKYLKQKQLGTIKVNKFLTWQGEVLDLIVTNHAESAMTLLKTFDYTVNAIAWPGPDGALSYSNTTLRDLWGMRLVSISEPTAYRKKYMLAKGFRCE